MADAPRQALLLAGFVGWVLAGRASAQAPPAAIDLAPPPLVAPYLPFPHLPAVPLDEANNGRGIAQKLCRERGYQGRILWIDGTANLDRVNSAEKIAALVDRIHGAGFNTIVFEVKPIIGLTLYPSKFAPKLTEWVRPWKTQSLPAGFDPLREMATRARARGISLLASVNAFSEGHREFPGKGLGWERPDWQSVLYEPLLRLRSAGGASDGASYPLSERPNVPAREGQPITAYTNLEKLPRTLPAGALLALVDGDGAVTAQIDAVVAAKWGLRLPAGAAALYAPPGDAAIFLRQQAGVGQRLVLETAAAFVPVGQRADLQVPLMTSPHHPEVRQRLLAILAEIVGSYDLAGVIFDDRLRYASLGADFSERARRDFEQWIGKGLTWPDDVFRWSVTFPSLERGLVPGPYYDAWLSFRALTLRNFVADAARTVKAIRPDALVATYVGSWYPDYPDLGANWAADDLPAGYRFLNETYKKTGWAGLVDFATTGCYYNTASLADATAKGDPVGETVEAAGQFSNRAVNDQTLVYAGISLDRFKGKPEELKRVLQAACATTQGVMCFDLSHDMEPLWSVFAETFQRPATAPHAIPGFLAEVRQKKAERKAAGVADPPVIQYRGASGTGF